MTRSWMAVMLLAVLAAPVVGQAAPAPAIMPLAEIKPGMRGVGKTVISGQRIDEFQFEVLDILQSGGGPIGVDKLIMFRMFGPLAERTGGTAAGMSGSPMYINGKLIGALSAAFSWQAGRRDISLATPIEDMLKVLDRRTAPSSRLPVYRASRPHLIGSRIVDRVVVAFDPLQARRLDVALPRDVAVATPAVVTFSRGLTLRANRILSDLLQPMGHEILQGHGGRGDFAAQPIEPGSSVGVQQVRGDVDFGGICTVTTRTGNRLLVCGHPWEGMGDVEYVLRLRGGDGGARDAAAVQGRQSRPDRRDHRPGPRGGHRRHAGSLAQAVQRAGGGDGSGFGLTDRSGRAARAPA